jgi:hypothetical protein
MGPALGTARSIAASPVCEQKMRQPGLRA